MGEKILLCISICLLMSCSPKAEQRGGEQSGGSSETTQKLTEQASSTEPELLADLPDCVENGSILLNGGAGDRTLDVLHCLAIRKINMNEQTDVGDVARSGYTICITDFELNKDNIWGRPPTKENQKVELRLFIPEGEENLPTGKYGAASGGRLQMAPVLYLGENTHPFMGNDLGAVHITKVTESEICGHMRARTKFGHKLEGSFTATIL